MAKKKGAPRKLEPDQLWDLFQRYVKHVKSNPFKVHDFIGREGRPDYREKEKPLIFEGFELFVWENSDFKSGLQDHFANRDGRYQDFTPVCENIRRAIRNDQISGGFSGIYNASITARVAGLVERSEVNVVKEQPLFDLGGDEKSPE